MVAQATVAEKVNSKNAVRVHQDQVAQVVTHDQVAMHARAETHVQLAILADLKVLHLVTHVKIAMSVTTAALLVRLVNASSVMIAELRLLGELAHKVTVGPLVRVNMS